MLSPFRIPAYPSRFEKRRLPKCWNVPIALRWLHAQPAVLHDAEHGVPACVGIGAAVRGPTVEATWHRACADS